jgi:hypothetical protein
MCRPWPTGVGACSATLSPLVELIRAMSWPPTGPTVTTPPCRCWPQQDRDWAAVGPTCGMTDRSVAAIRRPPCVSTRVTGVASIRAGISRAGPAPCRPMPMPASNACRLGDRAERAPNVVEIGEAGISIGLEGGAEQPTTAEQGTAVRVSGSRRAAILRASAAHGVMPGRRAAPPKRRL